MSDFYFDNSDLIFKNENFKISNKCSSKPISINSFGKEIFHVDINGNIIRNDIDITNNDKELVKCFIEFLEVCHKLNINREI